MRPVRMSDPKTRHADARRAVLIAVVLVALLLPGCDRSRPNTSAASSGPAASSDTDNTVIYLAGAGTTNASEEAVAAFTAETGIKVRFSPGPSNFHASQILSGAPANVFLPANEQWAKTVIDAGLAVESTPLFSNRLVIVVPKGNPAGIHKPADLLRDNVRRVALAGEKVPAGIYAGQSLRSMGIYDRLMNQGKVVRAEDVRFTLAYADQGEVDAAVVYATDARVAVNAEIACTFDADSHEPIVFRAVLLKTDEPNPAARRFYEFLQSPEAAAIFVKHGFTLAAPTAPHPQ